MNTTGLNPRMQALIGPFSQSFPGAPLTSGFRDPTYNARVGGARGSQHIHGNAVDFSLKGLDESAKIAALSWWRDRGATGFGYYPASDSAHVDFGAPRAWGPDYTRNSIGSTPTWFQDFVKVTPAPMAPGASPFGLDALQALGPTGGEEKPAPVEVGNTKGAALGKTGMDLMAANQGGQPAVDLSKIGPGPIENRPEMKPLPKRKKTATTPIAWSKIGGLLDG